MARFPRRARLLKPGEFQHAFKRGTRSNERWLTAVATTNSLDHPRLGLAIAKKSVPPASQRNRIKRQIRESFRAHQAQLPPLDIIIVARSGCGAASNIQLRQNLERLWARVAASSRRPPSS